MPHPDKLYHKLSILPSILLGFSRQEHWSAISSLGDLSDPGIKPASLALAGGFFTTVLPGKPISHVYTLIIVFTFSFAPLSFIIPVKNLEGRGKFIFPPSHLPPCNSPGWHYTTFFFAHYTWFIPILFFCRRLPELSVPSSHNPCHHWRPVPFCGLLVSCLSPPPAYKCNEPMYLKFINSESTSGTVPSILESLGKYVWMGERMLVTEEVIGEYPHDIGLVGAAQSVLQWGGPGKLHPVTVAIVHWMPIHAAGADWPPTVGKAIDLAPGHSSGHHS